MVYVCLNRPLSGFIKVLMKRRVSIVNKNKFLFKIFHRLCFFKSISSASVLPVYTEIHLFELTVYHLNLRCSTWVPLKIFAIDLVIKNYKIYIRIRKQIIDILVMWQRIDQLEDSCLKIKKKTHPTQKSIVGNLDVLNL